MHFPDLQVFFMSNKDQIFMNQCHQIENHSWVSCNMISNIYLFAIDFSLNKIE